MSILSPSNLTVNVNINELKTFKKRTNSRDAAAKKNRYKRSRDK